MERVEKEGSKKGRKGSSPWHRASSSIPSSPQLEPSQQFLGALRCPCCVHPRDPVQLLPSKGSPSRDAAAGTLTTAPYCRPPLIPLLQGSEGCSLGLPLKAVNCWSAPLWLFLQGWCQTANVALHFRLNSAL